MSAMRLPTPAAVLATLRDPQRWRRWVFEFLILVALFIGISLWQNRDLPSGPAPALAGMRNDGVFESLQRKVDVTAGNPRGAGRTVTLVAFWATWCPVCRAEEGNIEAVARDWPVVSVAMQSDDATAITRYLRQRGLNLPAIVDETGELARTWNVSGVPAHFIVDAAGNIRFRVVGYATEWGLRARLWWAERFPT